MAPSSEGSLQPIMGVEVVKDIIRSFCDDESAEARSLVSPKCREWFLPRILNKLAFCEVAVDLCHMLDEFHHKRNPPKSVAVRDNVKSAAIILDAPVRSGLGNWSAGLDVSMNDQPKKFTRLILVVIRDMPKLERLTLDLYGLTLEQAASFINLVLGRWNITYLHLSTKKAVEENIIGRCCKLKHLVLNRGITSPAYIRAASLQSRLTRLSLRLDERAAPDHLPAMSSRVLLDIAIKFPDLEWLILHERLSAAKGFTGRSIEASNHFNGEFQRFETALATFPKLVRFAFTLQWSKMVRVETNLPINQRRGENMFWTYKAEYLLHRIQNLEQICIMLEYPKYIKGVMTATGAPRANVKWALNLQDGSFPFGLDN